MQSKYSQRTRVVAAVCTRGEYLLLCKRPHHKTHGGRWEFPGGKCEPGEADGATLMRELKEELGVDVIAVGPIMFSILDPTSANLIVFRSTQIRGEPLCREHLDLQWVSRPKILELDLAPSDREFVKSKLTAP
jgi:mutator protein MutT